MQNLRHSATLECHYKFMTVRLHITLILVGRCGVVGSIFAFGVSDPLGCGFDPEHRYISQAEITGVVPTVLDSIWGLNK
jgi:hypothetical protein